jgi:hypothetical protein
MPPYAIRAVNLPLFLIVADQQLKRATIFCTYQDEYPYFNNSIPTHSKPLLQ